MTSEEAEKEGPYTTQDHDITVTLRISPKVISRNTSSSCFSNQTNNNSGNRKHGTPTSGIFNLVVPRVNIMVGNDIKLPIFNGNGLEDPEKHWFL